MANGCPHLTPATVVFLTLIWFCPAQSGFFNCSITQSSGKLPFWSPAPRSHQPARSTIGLSPLKRAKPKTLQVVRRDMQKSKCLKDIWWKRVCFNYALNGLLYKQLCIPSTPGRPILFNGMTSDFWEARGHIECYSYGLLHSEIPNRTLPFIIYLIMMFNTNKYLT